LNYQPKTCKKSKFLNYKYKIMKKIIFSLSFLFILFFPAVGQLKHVKGISNFGITYGITENSNVFGIGYSHYFQPKWILNLNVLYEKGNIESTRLKNFVANGGVDYTCFQAGEFLYFNTGVSLFAGFEKLTSEESSIEDIKNLTIGPSGNINVELYLSSKFLLQIKAEQYYSPFSNLGKWFPIYSLCLKYCF